MTTLYVLNADHTVEPMDDLVEWTARQAMDNNLVDFDEIKVDAPKPIEIVTAFTGTAHERWGAVQMGPPLVFATTIHGGGYDGVVIEHYASWADAQRGHDEWVATMRHRYGSSSSGGSSPNDSSDSGGAEA